VGLLDLLVFVLRAKLVFQLLRVAVLSRAVAANLEEARVAHGLRWRQELALFLEVLAILDAG